MLQAKDVETVLEELTIIYLTQALNRGVNGPEFIADALQNRCKNSGITTA